MKGCLKLTSPIPSPATESPVQHLDNLNGGARCCHTPTIATSTAQGQQTQRKCVAFCAEGSETVYTADEWDRTPTEPARKLSYQDLLELKEIQRSLPHANQPPDVVVGRPGKQFLSGVPIILLPLLGSDARGDGESAVGAQDGEAKKPSGTNYFPDVHGRPNGHANVCTNGSGAGWGPPSLTRKVQSQLQASPVRPSFPFPPRPVPFPTSKIGSSSTSVSPSLLPSSPTSPYPSSYSNRPYSNLPQQTPQARKPWSPPHSLSHLMPSIPIKPREKPKFEFVTLLDAGAGSNGSSGPYGGANDVGNRETTTTKVGSEVLVHPTSKLPSGLTEVKESDRDHQRHNDEHDVEDHDLISVTSSSCPSLCASSCPSSCSASEVDTDHEHEHEVDIEGKHYSSKRFSGLDRYDYTVRDGTLLPPLDVDVGFHLNGGLERGMTTVQPKRKERKKKFILVNDMEIELDESESESDKEDPVALSGRIRSSSNSMTREITTTKSTTIGKATAITTTSSGSPQGIVAPVPVKSMLGSSQHPSPVPSSASLITPPTTPPSEQILRYANKPSPTSSPMATRGRLKAVQKKSHVVGGSSSRERSQSVGSDTSGGSPRSCTGSPVKLKSKMGS